MGIYCDLCQQCCPHGRHANVCMMADIKRLIDATSHAYAALTCCHPARLTIASSLEAYLENILACRYVHDWHALDTHSTLLRTAMTGNSGICLFVAIF